MNVNKLRAETSLGILAVETKDREQLEKEFETPIYTLPRINGTEWEPGDRTKNHSNGSGEQ